jgi:8-amino-3,8-dideoxy-alpha-D-manno-octulosonate transaminase
MMEGNNMTGSLKRGLLAIRGGEPARKRPDPPMFPGGLLIDEKEEQAVMDVLRSKRLFRYYGPYGTKSKVDEFEKAFALLAEAKYALGVNSCTNALFISLIACGVQPGDEVIIPSYTFVATAAAVVAANAIPVIVEIDESFTIDTKEVEKSITSRTKAIIPVHMRGAPANMDSIYEIAQKYNLKVIEDVAQANGGTYKGKSLGTLGDAGCFSFQYHKVITAGEGGAIISNNKSIINRAKALHDTGANWRNDDSLEDKSEYPIFPGFNCRMNEITGAILLVQLAKRSQLLNTMRSYQKQIQNAVSEFTGVQLRKSIDPEGDIGICIMFIAPSKEKALEISSALNAERINTSTMGGESVPDWHIYYHWKHILQKRGNNDIGYPFNLSNRDYFREMCPRTIDLLSKAVHLDVNPHWIQEDVDQTIFGLEKVFYQLL